MTLVIIDTNKDKILYTFLEVHRVRGLRMSYTWSIAYVILIIMIAWSLIYILYIRFRDKFNKHGVEIAPFTLIWKFRSELSFLNKLARKSIIKYYEVYSVLASILCIFLFYYILFIGIMGIIGKHGMVTVVPYVPGLTVKGVNIFYSLIAIVVALIVHEFSHGVVALAEKVPLRSTGLLLLFIFPGAFVEPDKEVYEKSSRRKKLYILAAGSAANVIIALIAMLLIYLVTSPQPLITSTLNVINGQYTAVYLNNVKVPVPSSIISVNGTKVNSLEDFVNILNLYKHSTVTFNITLFDYNTLTYTNILIHKPYNVSYLGVLLYPRSPNMALSILPIDLFIHLVEIIRWLFIINLGLAVVNSAPLFITDGGRIIHEVLFKGNKMKSYIIQGVTLILFIIIIVHSLIMYLR